MNSFFKKKKQLYKTCITRPYSTLYERWPLMTWPWPYLCSSTFTCLRYKFITVTSEFRREKWPKNMCRMTYLSSFLKVHLSWPDLDLTKSFGRFNVLDAFFRLLQVSSEFLFERWPKNMCRMAMFLHVWKLTFCDLTLTWTLLSTIPWALKYLAVAI